MMLRRLIAAVAGCAALAMASSAGASVTWYLANLSGPNESPANASPGIGFAQVAYDDVLHTMSVDVTFSGLLGTVTASHIHCCTLTPGVLTAGVATTTPTFTGFPSGVTSGVYHHAFDMTLASSYNPAFIPLNGGTPASAETALFLGMAQGRSYLNIHSTQFPGGEIRGFLSAPEPSTWAMMIMGMGLAGAALRRRRRRAAFA